MKDELYDQINAIEHNHWWYVGRRAIIFDSVLQILKDLSDPIVLDIGCGTGFNSEYLRAKGYTKVIGLDLSTRALGYCQSRGLSNLVCGDGIHPPFRAASFDLIMALDLIEHIEDDNMALKALADTLRSGGSLVIFTPALMFLWGRQDEVSHHYRRYTAKELRQKLEGVGLCVKHLTYVNMLLFVPIWLGRIILRLFGNHIQSTSENDLHPGWSNSILQMLFLAERRLLRHFDLPIGVSLLCVVTRPEGL